MRVNHSANGTTGQTDWNAVSWKRTNRIVRNLRQRIFKASKAGDTCKVRQLQKLMLRSQSNVLLSVRQVTQVNDGRYTPGLDKLVVKTAAAKGKLVDEVLSHEPWKVSPARRVYIPKSNGKFRPLGIPTIIDRVHQARVKNALEPEWEARFEATSYGFRPGRGCHDAIQAIYGFARPHKRKKWVVDADIKGAFDTISHNFLLDAISTFPAKALIKQWLKAGYVDKGVFYATETGTPQGGIVSPLLANIALHGMEAALGVKRSKYTHTVQGPRGVVRYADDFVVFCETKEDAQAAVIDLRKWLAGRNLKLSEEKTRIVHLTDGFDFLGFNIRLYKWNTRTGLKLLITPSKDSVRALKDRLRSDFMRLRGSNAAAVIRHFNPIIRGWANYYRISASSRTFHNLNLFMYHRCVRWMKRQHPGKSLRAVRHKYWGRFNKRRNDNWVFGDKASGAYLCKFTWVPIKRHTMVKGSASKDDPALTNYWRARAIRSAQLKPDKLALAKSQSFVCPNCGESLFNGEEVQEHHVIQDKRKEARGEKNNRRLVHLICHQQIHHGHPSKLTPRVKELLSNDA